MMKPLRLRDYQMDDALALASLNAAGCFNEQRTGKTPTALTVMKLKNFKMVLITCPASMVPVWADEIHKWLGESAITCTGTPAEKHDKLMAWPHSSRFLIISYAALRSGHKRIFRGSRTAVSLSIALHRRLLYADVRNLSSAYILDEAHRIKSRTNKQATAVLRYRNVFDYRLALTATLAHNKSHDAWAVLNFLYPNTFPSYWDYIDEHYLVELQHNQYGDDYRNILGYKPGHKKEIQNILSRISTQRKRKDVMPWLPDKDIQQVYLDPAKRQVKYLNDLFNYYETGDVITQGTLDRLIRYRQICLDPTLLHLPSLAPKTGWVLDYITDYPEKSIIIFSKFTTYLKLLKAHLGDTAELFIGATSDKKRTEIKSAFQAGKLKVLLLNIDAGKEGLTLDTGDVIIFTDRFPPVGDLLQAEDRFIATIPENANTGHTIFQLVLKGTYDEELHTLIENNASEVDVINNFNKYLRG